MTTMNEIEKIPELRSNFNDSAKRWLYIDN